MTTFNEPIIVINGVTLTTGQAMTVRVALGSYMIDLTRDGLGDDEVGKDICRGYIRCCHELHRLMGLCVENKG